MNENTSGIVSTDLIAFSGVSIPFICKLFQISSGFFLY